MYCRLIAPKWLTDKDVSKPKVLEGEFSEKQLKVRNAEGYNVYYTPNGASRYDGGTLDGTHIDTFSWVFVDCDLKDKRYEDKDAFIAVLVDSGNGIHAYWKVSDLDAYSYLRLQRRLARHFKTDIATTMIFQLMRLPGYKNTKNDKALVDCHVIAESEASYSCEELDAYLPPITIEDEEACKLHYDMTYHRDKLEAAVDDKIPAKFGKLLNDNPEVKEIWASISDDRSKSDYRLGHIMFATGFTKQEAASVLMNSAKALTRAPIHRVTYAENIISKIWTFELEPEKNSTLSASVADILKRSSSEDIKGVRFKCHKRIDNTKHGFRLGHVLGLVGGSGIGKTSFAMNMFKWFAEENPDYHHFFVPLEQPANEIADRWKTMCGDNTALHNKVHVISNYDEQGNFRHLSLDEIKDYLIEWQKESGLKIGCVVIDHIGALKKKGAKEENQDLMTICHNMKAFAVQTNTFLIMQSQTSREKAGIGDLELNKDAAYGTLYFEAYCDFLVTLWQPLKRCHNEETCPVVTAFKFCKIRHKKTKIDVIQEDVPYWLAFDPDTETMRDMTQDEKVSFNFFLPKATNKRKSDKKTELVQYQSVPYKEENVETEGDRHTRRH